MTDHALRPKDGWCFKCGGGYMTLGNSTRWVPHESWCPKVKGLRPQTVAEQDAERAALAPMSVEDGDLMDSPWVDDEDMRRRALFHAGVYVPKPKDEETT